MERSINKDIISHVDHVIEDCYLLLKSESKRNAELINSILKEASVLRKQLLAYLKPAKPAVIAKDFKNSLNYRLMELYGRLNGV